MNTERTSLFLMANLGSEVSRILYAKEKGEKDSVKEAEERAYKIIEEIRLLADMQPRAEEVQLLQDVITDISKDKPSLDVQPQNLKNYFIPFAVRLMS